MSSKSTSKPVIGLNLDYRAAAKSSPSFSYVAAGYYDSISEVNGVPMLIPPVADDDDLNQLLDLVDAVVMIGGADLDPRRDGFMLHPSVRMQDVRRETFDRRLMNQVSRRRLPVFGIGAGMQLLNVSQGGNLFLHIPEDLPKALPHADSLDKGHRHALDIVPDSLMWRVFGDGEIRVNSMHHMAIDEVARGFRVTGRCPDGVVECIESEMPDWLAIGTQFHPESDSASALDMRIFEEFVDGVKAREAGNHEFQLVAA